MHFLSAIDLNAEKEILLRCRIWCKLISVACALNFYYG